MRIESQKEVSRSKHYTKAIPIVGVMGSGKASCPSLTLPLGEWLARQEIHLLTGGGGGLMSEVSKAFFEVNDRVGSVLGIIPAKTEENPALSREGYPNEWVEIAIRTHLPKSGAEGQSYLSRNHINILTSDVIIILPGKNGTKSEAELAKKYGRPHIGYYNEGNMPAWFEKLPFVSTNLDEVKAFVSSNKGKSPFY